MVSVINRDLSYFVTFNTGFNSWTPNFVKQPSFIVVFITDKLTAKCISLENWHLSGSARFQILGKTWPTRDFRKLHTLTGEVEQLDLTWPLKGERGFLKFLNFHNATLYYKISENRSNDLWRPTGTSMITSELKGEVTVFRSPSKVHFTSGFSGWA